jgi:hypothetical protein
VAAGYGITPYGIGDWGSENSFVPGVGALSIQSEPPIVQTGIIPSGGTVLIGSAPVAPIIDNPNWVNINDSQTPNWVGIAA